MPFATRYVFIVGMDVRPDKEDLFNEVHDGEHVPELLKVPGVISVTRSKKRPAVLSVGGEKVPVGEGEPTYLAFYELESPDVLTSDAWIAAVDKGRWPGEVRPYTGNRHYATHEVIGPAQ